MGSRFRDVRIKMDSNQRLLRATSWYELFAPLSNLLQSGVLCKAYTFVRKLHAPEKIVMFVRRDCPDLVQKESLMLRKKIVIITQKGTDIFSK